MALAGTAADTILPDVLPAAAPPTRKATMPRSRFEFTYGSTDTSRIPDCFVEAASLLAHMQDSGLVGAIGERLRIRRQGGFPALDIVLLLLVYLSCGLRRGLRLVWREHLSRCGHLLSALAVRERLPSPAAVSRALDSVEPDLIRPGIRWLLGEGAGIDEVLQHPASSAWDTRGQPWHLFDLDPTVTTLRHRALPQDEELPEPQRRSTDTGGAGYSGRKRGDIQFRRIAVQHAGSGAWVHSHLSAGNGEGVADLELGLDAIAATCDRLGAPRARAMVRMDGEYGHVPGMTACRERGLPLLTRINRASLYEDPVVLGRLRTATWRAVPDSLSGPNRLAADLGELTLAPGQSTRRADGSEYEPVTVRVVASIYRDTGKTGRGRVLGGWRVELFAADLPQASWPAEDCVWLYFGRTAEENRFAQEDRELGLDRILSYHRPGQELASAVGLFLWNLRLVLGFQSETPPAQAPVPRMRPADRDVDSPCAHWPPDPRALRLLDELDWDVLLAKRPDWSWDAAAGGLHCPDGRLLYITCVPANEAGQPRRDVVFRRPTAGCEDCAPRAKCYRTVRELGSKHATLQIPAEVADEIGVRLTRIRQEAHDHPKSPPRALQAATAPLLLPAEARSAHRERFAGATFQVAVEMPEPEPTRPRLVAADERAIQQRRKTWQQRVEGYALPDGARVRVHVLGGRGLRSFLGHEPSRRRRAAGEPHNSS
jgi:hypothetical protein